MKPRVLFVSGREVGYIRNRVLIEALQRHHEVSVLTTGWQNTIARMVTSLARFMAKPPDYDICVAGFYAQPLAIALSCLQRKPIILDAYVSTYDTLCEDRQWFRPHSLVGRMARWLDRTSCEVAQHILSDTQAHANYFNDVFGIALPKITPIYVGCDESVFFPRPQPATPLSQAQVFHYGSFLPLHGTDVIIQAAARLRHRPDIVFVLGGDGAQRPAIQRTIRELNLDNIKLVGWVPFDRLPQFINAATVCLGGHFSTIPKAARVVATKTYQFIAMERATIVADVPASHEVFCDRENASLVPVGDPDALANAIQDLVDDDQLRQRLALGGRQLFQRRFTTEAIASQLAQIITG